MKVGRIFLKISIIDIGIFNFPLASQLNVEEEETDDLEFSPEDYIRISSIKKPGNDDINHFI